MNQLNIKRNSKIFISLLFFILLVFIIPSKHKQDLPLIIDLQQIRSRGKLIATTENNAIDYFIYRGQPMGFQLELLQWFAKHIGVKLELILSNDKSQAISKLINHKCDIVAMDVINNSNAAIVFTIPYAYTRQVLVQRKPPGWQYMSKDSLEKLLVRQLYQLRGKTIFVPVESFEYYKNFSNFLTFGYEPVFFSKVAGMDSWELIALVASGEIDYTITNEFTANLNNMFFKDLDFKTVLTPPHPLTWAVRRESSILLDSLNSWIKYISKTHEYKILCLRYLKNQSYSRMLKNAYFPLKGGKISPYDKEFKKLSKEINWDWRLLASLVYQESRFDTGYIGLGGAMGLMQLMPITAQNYNVDSNSTTLENLKAGVRYIKWLDKHYEDIYDANERIFFIIAAYNVGHGHIDDARALAKKYNHNPNIWYGNVETFLKLKSKPQYYQDPLVKSGYCKCNTVSKYVEEVIQRYKHYVNVTTKKY